MSKLLHTILHKNNLLVLAIGGLAVIAFLLVMLTIKPMRDDLIFAVQTPHYTLFGWLAHRWNTWTSRMIPEALTWLFSQHRIMWWAFATTVVYAVFLFYLFQYYRVVQPLKKIRWDVVTLTSIVVMGWILSNDITQDTILWMTGSLNYFWTGVLFVIAFYVPYHVILKGELPKKIYTVFSVIATIVLPLAQEQFGFCLAGLLVVVTAYYIYRYKRNDIIARLLVGLTLVVVVLLVIVLKAPGNDLRLGVEINAWLPSFRTTPLTLRASSDIRWFLDGVINHMGFLFVVLWGLMAALLRKQGDRVLALILMAAAVFVFIVQLLPTNTGGFAILGQAGIEKMAHFHNVWAAHASHKSWIIVAGWLGILLVTLYAPFRIYKKELNKAIVSSALLLFGAGATALLWASPTMYASGYRTFYAQVVLLELVVIVLIVECLKRRSKSRQQ